MKIPKKGTLVRITWDDICGFTNSDIGEVRPARCVTIGTIQKKKGDFLIVSTSLFMKDSPRDALQGDFLALPLGIIRSIEALQQTATSLKTSKKQQGKADSMA